MNKPCQFILNYNLIYENQTKESKSYINQYSTENINFQTCEASAIADNERVGRLESLKSQICIKVSTEQDANKLGSIWCQLRSVITLVCALRQWDCVSSSILQVSTSNLWLL